MTKLSLNYQFPELPILIFLGSQGLISCKNGYRYKFRKA